VLTGGGPLPGKGWFYAPTVITDVPTNARIAVEEIFGPVAPISTFATEPRRSREPTTRHTG
jgi:succinate-semialdehyde dehydrogenase/glutarate-semialdehyde dehydrogenase